ncbi:MAG: hypothetical protein POG74_09745 [Acidocella sp.]|nr:hypothetical protein [Acidocella sp.]
MRSARIEIIYAKPNNQLALGGKLFDISIDLSSSFAQNCPPISYHRVVLREKLWLRTPLAKPGEYWEPDACIALLSNEPTESLNATIARPARIMAAGIVYHPEMWSGTHA